MNSVVKVSRLSVCFGDFYAVKDVSFEVKSGEIFGFLGANGAGKTTTIRVLCGILSPTSGEIEVAGQRFQTSGSHLKMKVGYMSQKFTLYDDMTVDENLNFTASIHRLKPDVVQKAKIKLLSFINWQRPLNIMVRDLPGGQKQQISLIASIMHDPEIIFLDEPTAGVSPAARNRFWDIIRQLVSNGKTVFVTTHYMDEAEQCDRIALMSSGELVALNSPSTLKLQTFPKGLYELQPINELTDYDLEKIKNDPIFSMFKHYGMRFHAEIKGSLEQYYSTWFSKLFEIQPIKPSLEDVFIRIVEGKTNESL